MRILAIALTLALLLAGIGWWLFGAPSDVRGLDGPQAERAADVVDPGELSVRSSDRREFETEVVASGAVNESEGEAPTDPEAVIVVHLLVVEEGSRTPLFGVELRDLGPQLHHFDTVERPGSRKLIGTTDAHGSLSAEVPHTEGRLLSLEHRLYAPRVLNLDEPVGTAEEPLVVELSRSASIFGRVLGATQDDTLFVRTVSGSRGVGVATGARGTAGFWYSAIDLSSGFEVDGLPGACELEAELRLAKGGKRGFGRFVLTDGERREMHWSLTGPGSISGVCVDEAGGALSGLEIKLHDARLLAVASKSDCPECYTTTDLAGTFRFDGLPLGEYRIFDGFRDERGLVMTQSGAAHLTEARKHVELTLTYTRQLSITGVVRLPNGDPAGEMQVNLIPAAGGAYFGFTESDGRFEFDGLRPGEYWLHCGTPDSKEHVAPPPVRISAGSQDVDVRMLAAGSLRVSLVDARSGDPVEGRVFVDALQDESFRPLNFDRLRTEHLARRLRPGAFVVRAEADGRAFALVRDVRVHAGQETALELRLEPAAQLDFTYTGAATRVQLDGLQAGVRVAMQTFEPGESASWNLPAGPLTLELRSYLESAGVSDQGVNQWKVVATRELTLIVGETLQLELRE
jgi:hypothetical protein